MMAGGVLGLLIYVIGAPIFNDRIEDDLERRVPAELADAGYAGVVAAFSGQDGTLTCEQPLADPENALAAAYDIWGVRAIELDRSCRVNRAPTIATTTLASDTSDSADTSDLIDVDAASEDAVATSPPTSTTTTVPDADFESVAEIVATSPELSLLAVLTEEANFVDVLGTGSGDSREITLFAPTDAAFDALPADAVARLRDDPTVLRAVLEHHVLDVRVMSDDLVTGEIASRDGGALDVVVTDGRVTVDGAAVTGPDIVAANGVVHVVDAVLLPPDADLSAASSSAEVSATFADAKIMLDGVVATEVERAALVTR